MFYLYANEQHFITFPPFQSCKSKSDSFEMKYSTFFLIFVFALLAFAQAAPGDVKGKPKPKPKPKRHHDHSGEVIGVAPSMAPSKQIYNPASVDASDTSILAQTVSTTEQSSGSMLESGGMVAVLCGVAVACVVAIVAVVRAPTHVHEPLPQTSESVA
jgi:hypothetical protein